MQEIWKDIEGYEGLYQVSDQGRIKSMRYSTRYRCNMVEGAKPHIIKPSPTANGYRSVTLYKGPGVRRKYLIHRLVAMAFVPNPNGFDSVNHKDEDKSNNCASNLEWCTIYYNNNYGTARLRTSYTKGSPIMQSTLEGIPIAIYASVGIAESVTGVDRHGIIDCCHGKIGASGGYLWKRLEESPFSQK